jgi:hypothetical protein
MQPRSFVAGVIFAAGVLGPARSADAVERKGFVIGLGAGFGQTRIEGESNTGIGANFHVGGMLGEKTALLLEAYGVGDQEEDDSATFGVSGVAVQRFLGDKAWVKAGLGQGFVNVSSNGHSETESHGLGILGAVGYELVQKTKFTLDLQGRFSTSSKDGVRVNNFGVNVGVNWW